MQIISIKYRKNNADIETDAGLFPKVSLSALLVFKIVAGQTVEDERFALFLKESEKDQAKEYLFGLLGRGAKTEAEARRKLYEHKFSKESQAYALEMVKSYGYLNDEAYAKNYVEQHQHTKGGYRLKQELMQKGVDKQVIDAALQGVERDESGACLQAAQKYMRGKTLDNKTKEKLYRHLMGRGFGYEAIGTALSQMATGDEDETV